MNKYLASSADPTKYSATIQGILIGIIPLVIFIGQKNGIEFTYNELVILVELFMGVVSSIVIFVGVARKIYIKILG